MTINDNEYDAILGNDSKTVFALFSNTTMADVANLGDTVTIVDNNGSEYIADRLMSIELTGDKIKATWNKHDDVDAIKAEAKTYHDKLEAVRTALLKLMVGIPTITEYVAFVKSVKEVLGIE